MQGKILGYTTPTHHLDTPRSSPNTPRKHHPQNLRANPKNTKNNSSRFCWHFGGLFACSNGLLNRAELFHKMLGRLAPTCFFTWCIDGLSAWSLELSIEISHRAGVTCHASTYCSLFSWTMHHTHKLSAGTHRSKAPKIPSSGIIHRTVRRHTRIVCEHTTNIFLLQPLTYQTNHPTHV